MSNRSLIEYKLRIYFNVGHEYSMYIPRSIRDSFWEKGPRNLPNFVGVRLVGKIVKNNKTEEINSIVPIILKVKKEGKLLDEQHLIFTLAVCARFNLKQCVKMVSDAFNAVSSVCTDGLKLLMFVKFFHDVGVILHIEGYTSHIPSGFGKGFQKAMKNWYLNGDPLATTEMIVREANFEGWTHRDVMKLIHIHSNDPTRYIFIVHTLFDMKMVEELFGHQANNISIDNYNETFERIQLKFIYGYLKKIDDLKKMNETKLVTQIELERWGHDFKVIPMKKRMKPAVISALIVHMPLRDVLDNTFFFAKQKLFTLDMENIGLLLYKACFINRIQMQKHYIHPIESYLEFVKYSRTFKNIVKTQNNILKKKGNYSITLDEDKLKYFHKKSKRPNNNSSSQISNTLFEKKDCTIQFNSTNDTFLPQKSGLKLKSIEPGKNKLRYDETLKQISKLAEPRTKKLADSNNQPSNLNIGIPQNNFESESNCMVLLKPPPKINNLLEDFLSKDLFKKSLKLLEPTGQRILIAYDNRKHMRKYKCKGTNLLSVHEAITLITISLIVPEKPGNKPTVHTLNNEFKTNKIEISYDDTLSFTELENILFKEKLIETDPDYENKNIGIVNPYYVINQARENKEEYDVFVFLGTNKINYKNIQLPLKRYRQFLQKPVKIISCCLNGKHSQQWNLNRGNMLFIAGFDKSIGKLIHSFLKGEF